VKNWRTIGSVVFALFALMELGDWSGLLGGYSDPASYADLIGVRLTDERMRLYILTILSLGIVIASAGAAVTLADRSESATQFIGITQSLFIIYGIYQLLSAASQVTKQKELIVMLGMFYALCSLVALWIGNKISQTTEQR
jgi:hypothetical protein